MCYSDSTQGNCRFLPFNIYCDCSSGELWVLRGNFLLSLFQTGMLQNIIMIVPREKQWNSMGGSCRHGLRYRLILWLFPRGTIDTCKSMAFLRFPRTWVLRRKLLLFIVPHGNGAEYDSDCSPRKLTKFHWWRVLSWIKIQTNIVTCSPAELWVLTSNLLMSCYPCTTCFMGIPQNIITVIPRRN